MLKRVEEKLKNFKHWKDEYGITWIEVNNQKFPKKQFVEICLEQERLAALKNQFNFLAFKFYG